MALFGRRPTKRKSRPRKEVTFDQALERSLIAKAKTDKPWAERVALRQRKLEDSPGDPVEAKKLELKAKMLDMAMEHMDNDPKTLEVYSARMLEELFGPDPVYDNDGNYVPTEEYESGSSIRHLIEELRELEELKDTLGLTEDKSSNIFTQLLNTETFKHLGGVIAQRLFGVTTKPNGGERVFVVSVNGSPVEVTESQYAQLMEQGKVTPLGEVTVERRAIPETQERVGETPTAEKPTEPQEPKREEVHMEKPPQEIPARRPGHIQGGEIRSTRASVPRGIHGSEIDTTGLPMREGGVIKGTGGDYGVIEEGQEEGQVYQLPEELLPYLDLEMISQYLNEQASVLADDLEAGVGERDEVSMFLWGFLASSTVDGVLTMLAPYSDHEQVGEYVQMLLADEGRDWLVDLISLIKMRESHSHYLQEESQ